MDSINLIKIIVNMKIAFPLDKLRYMYYYICIMQEGLTVKQKQVLITIKDLQLKNGRPPTLKELSIALGYAGISSIQRHMDALRKKGYITSVPYEPRSLEITTEGTVNIPLVGNVACGQPLLAVENIEAYIPYEKSRLRGNTSEYFFLRAVGDSMDLAGIESGDFVLVKQQNTADINEKIVALIGDEATIKKLKKGEGYYILKPESSNPSNKPIYMFDEFTIQGVVKDVIKKVGE